MIHVIKTHSGLGDFFCQFPLYCKLSEVKQIAIPCYEDQFISIYSAISWNDNINLYIIPSNAKGNRGFPDESELDLIIERNGFSQSNQIKIGMYSGKSMEWDFSKSFYEHAGVDYGTRFDHTYGYRILQASRSVEQTEWPRGATRAFLHDDPDRGFIIRDDYQNIGVSTFNNGQSILRYVNMITTARYIDVIDSAFYWLIELLGPFLDPECDLRLHRYSKNAFPRDYWWKTKLNWKYID